MSRLRDLVARAKTLDMPALALTDHGALYGAVFTPHDLTEETFGAALSLLAQG